MYISIDQLFRMIAFVGYGDFSNAEIIFFGNEEGTAGGPDLEIEINKRCHQYLNEGTPICSRNPEAGFYIIPQNNIIGNIPMLQFQARLLLHLINQKVDWFQTKANKPARFECIKAYTTYLLYKETSPLIKSALVDLGPLPRSNGNAWLYENLNRRQYDRAFSYENQDNIDNYYLELSLQRSKVIKRLLNKCGQAKILIGIGKKDIKKRFLTQAFNNPHFDILDLGNSFCHYTELSMENGKLIHVFLCDFFNNRNFKLNNLQALAEKIYPLI